MNHVPVISLADESTAPDLIAEAYEQVGFCVITDHGIDPDLTDALFDASRRFHELDPAEKQTLAVNEFHRGFLAMNTSTVVTSSVADNRRPNQSESLMLLHDPHPDDAGLLLAGPNQWPLGRDDIRHPAEAYREAMTGLGQRLVTLIARALGEPDDVFGAAFERPTSWLRLLRYPPHPLDAPDDLYGSAPHTDYGFITLVASPGVDGLEIQLPEGGWSRPPSIPGALVMNAGDMLHRWSNGRFRSTPHRVVNTQSAERWSAPFFFDPHVSTVVQPLPGQGTPRFEPVLFEQYLAERLKKNYNQHHERDLAGS